MPSDINHCSHRTESDRTSAVYQRIIRVVTVFQQNIWVITDHLWVNSWTTLTHKNYFPSYDHPYCPYECSQRILIKNPYEHSYCLPSSSDAIFFSWEPLKKLILSYNSPPTLSKEFFFLLWALTGLYPSQYTILTCFYQPYGVTLHLFALILQMWERFSSSDFLPTANSHIPNVAITLFIVWCGCYIVGVHIVCCALLWHVGCRVEVGSEGTQQKWGKEGWHVVLYFKYQ